MQPAQFLAPNHRKRLIQNGNCLIVSLPSENGYRQHTQTTHAHLFDGANQTGSSRRVRLVMACYPSIVLAYDSEIHKDLAAKRIKSLKFQLKTVLNLNIPWVLALYTFATPASRFKVSSVMKAWYPPRTSSGRADLVSCRRSSSYTTAYHPCLRRK